MERVVVRNDLFREGALELQHFVGHAATLELAETEVGEGHWSW